MYSLDVMDVWPRRYECMTHTLWMYERYGRMAQTYRCMAQTA